MLSKAKDTIAQKHGYADWVQIEMTDTSECEQDAVKASLLDEVAKEYAALRSQQLEELLKDFLRVLDAGLSIQPNSALHHCLKDIINTETT